MKSPQAFARFFAARSFAAGAAGLPALAALLALAAPEALAAGGAFPAKAVFFQALNFAVFFALLAWLARKPLKSFFAAERERFLSFEREAREKEELLAKELELWKKKLADLEAREKTVGKSADEEGRLFLAEKRGLLKGLAKRLKREADFLLRLESEKARAALLKEGKRRIAALTEALMKGEGESALQKSLGGSFFKQLERRPPAAAAEKEAPK